MPKKAGPSNSTSALCATTTRGCSAQLGPDTGFDSIGDFPQASALGRLSQSARSRKLAPKTILYNNNPIDNYVFATMIGNFQDGSIPGKLQFGTGWWFLDQREGMEWQMNALSNCGLLSRFVGMVTDSRSFMSYPRHEYFRRTLCNLIGGDVARGEIPDDEALLGPMIRNICYANAKNYFVLPDTSPAVAAKSTSSNETSRLLERPCARPHALPKNNRARTDGDECKACSRSVPLPPGNLARFNTCNRVLRPRQFQLAPRRHYLRVAACLTPLSRVA